MEKENLVMSAPMVSVIIPTHNRSELLQRSVGSVISQTFTDWELIIIDDASTDDTAEVVEGFRDGRIRLIRQSENRGAPAARNRGVREAKGEYVAFLDSDDEWMPRKLEQQVLAFASPKAQKKLAVVTCNLILRRTENGKVREQVTPRRLLKRKRVFEDLLARRNIRVTSTIMVKRSFLTEEFMFDESLRSGQEWDFLLRLARSHRFDCVDEFLLIKHLHGGPTVSSSEGKIEGLLAILNKYKRELKKRPGARSSHHQNIAFFYWRTRDFSNASKHIRGAIRATPLSLQLYRLYFQACLKQALPNRDSFPGSVRSMRPRGKAFAALLPSFHAGVLRRWPLAHPAEQEDDDVLPEIDPT